MQLRLERGQEQKKRSVEFVLVATALLSEEEAALVQRYHLGNEVLVTGTITVGMLSRREEPFSITVTRLANGWTQRFEDLGAMLMFEERLKESCKTLLAYLAVARTFGGTETLDIELPG